MPEAKEYLVLSNSKVKTWNRCPKQWEFKYIYGLRPKKKTVQLERGSWVHELLMVHYDGQDWRERHAELTAAFYELFEEEREDLGDLPTECGRLVKNYLYHWRQEDKLYRTIDTELDEILELPNGLKIRIIIDKILEDRSGGIWVVDYKTGKNFLDPDWLILDPQLARYHWAADKLGYTPLRGVFYDEIRTFPPTLPKVLKSGRLEQRKNIRCDVYTYFEEVKRHNLSVKKHATFLKYLKANTSDWFRRTPLPKDAPLTKRVMQEMVISAREMKAAEELGQFRRTPMKDCRWDCAFSNPCIVQLTGGNIKPILKAHYEPKEVRDE